MSLDAPSAPSGEPGQAPALILALMIGELKYQPTLNRISTRIVEEAVSLWRAHPSATLVCESAPMRAAALQFGAPPDRTMTALPQPRGHKTHLVAKWLAQQRPELPAGRWLMVTHTLHADRARRVLAKHGLVVSRHDIDVEFDAGDFDWKLRSERWFRFYNLIAEGYCRLRRWV